jgi:hypothetical protein
MKNLLTLLRISNFDISSIPGSDNHVGILKKDMEWTGVVHCTTDTQQTKVNMTVLSQTIISKDEDPPLPPESTGFPYRVTPRRRVGS